MSPVMREETVVNKKPKTITKMAARKLAKRPVCAPGMGRKVRRTQIIAATAAAPRTTNFMGKSCSMRLATRARPSRPAFISFNPVLSAAQMVGSVFARVITPAAATAPAPIGRI